MANTMTLISSVTVGAGGAANMNFSSIPSTYTDLQLFVSARTTRASQIIDTLKVTFNGSASSYSSIIFQGNGASAGSYTGASTSFDGDNANAAGSTSNTFTNWSIYVPNYAGSTNKPISIDAVIENNATTAYDELTAGLWSNTSAITQVTLTSVFGSLVQYSTAYLYGIKNS